jgi:hypothetical protein
MSTKARVGSFKVNYGKEDVSSFTPQELERLRELHTRFDATFADISSTIATELKCDPAQAEEAAEAAMEEFELAVLENWDAEFPHPNDTRLMALLKKQREIWEEIMNVRDEVFVREHPDLAPSEDVSPILFSRPGI